MAKKTRIAICYDFDKTLSPKDMQTFGFIEQLGIEENQFWKLCADFGKSNEADQILSYMYVMIKTYKDKNLPLTKEVLENFGKNIKLFKGVDTWFDRINEYANSKDIELEHYIISSGLKEMISGCEIAKHFKKIYASYFVYDSKNKPVWPALAVNYTNKTQFLFRINKGVLDINDDSINEVMDEETRPVPFTNMIYLGDSYTDVPSMRLVMKSGGIAIGVYQNDQKSKIRLTDMLKNDKLNYIAAADYSENSVMEKLIKGLIKSIKNASDLKELTKLQKKKLQ